MRFQSPKGTHDVLPSQSSQWRALEQIFARLVQLYGYQELRTPAFEDTELFVRSSGETSDIVTKQMYTFWDKSDPPNSLTLKPEGTAPAIRAYLQHSLGQSGQVTRLWYMTQVFRYERPQKGRFRQSHQLGLELIGTSSPAADAEIIEITVRFYQSIGLSNIKVLLNSIGREETRNRYKEALLKHVDTFLSSLLSEEREKILKNPLRLVDSKDPKIQESLQDGPTIQDFLEDSSKVHFELLQRLLQEAGIPFQVSPSTVRGLDYYTDTVFEIHSDQLGAQSALCGGGRYDNLVSEMGGLDTPCVGVGIGMERALMVLPKAFDGPKIEIFVISATQQAASEVRTICEELRVAGISALYDLDSRSIKSQMRQADRHGVQFSIIVGDDELSSGMFTIKVMQTSTEYKVARAELVEKVSTWLIGD